MGMVGNDFVKDKCEGDQSVDLPGCLCMDEQRSVDYKTGRLLDGSNETGGTIKVSLPTNVRRALLVPTSACESTEAKLEVHHICTYTDRHSPRILCGCSHGGDPDRNQGDSLCHQFSHFFHYCRFLVGCLIFTDKCQPDLSPLGGMHYG